MPGLVGEAHEFVIAVIGGVTIDRVVGAAGAGMPAAGAGRVVISGMEAALSGLSIRLASSVKGPSDVDARAATAGGGSAGARARCNQLT